MREIKFRGYNKENKKWLKSMTIIKDKDKYFIMLDELQDGELKPTLPVEEASIGQYTGFKDKNGVEIYEGDIIRADDDVDYTIEFDADSGWIGIHEDDVDMVHNLSIICNEFYAEVVGNTYEEKLKEGK